VLSREAICAPVKDQPEASSRLEGLVTSDLISQAFIDPMHDPSAIGSPVSGLIFQLRSDGLTHYAESDHNGRFVFDGLPAGSYELLVFASGYPQTNQWLAGWRRLFLKEKSYARRIFVLPRANRTRIIDRISPGCGLRRLLKRVWDVPPRPM
jgi:hypothetical protein